MLLLTAKNLSDLPAVSEKIISFMQDTRVLLLNGPMGAGKTTLVSQLCKVLNVTDEVSSPTYSIINEYHTTDGDKVFHFDFYRLNNIDEAYHIGAEDYFFSGKICLIEWPGIIMPFLPDDYMEVKIEVINETRHYTLLKSVE